jgi:group I intron endonuclease
MDEYFVYRHVNKINGKQYIGMTKQNPPSNRWGSNGDNYKENPHFYAAIEKYGWNNFLHEILYSGLSKEDACQLEMDLIKEYNTQDRNYGYNIFEGGQCPSIPKETRDKMSKSMMGNQNGLGKKCSEEKKKKISDAQKGKKLTDEHKNAISNAKKGKSHKPLDAISRKKIADKHRKKRVYCDETDTIYESVQECARQLKLFATNVCKACKGKIKSIGGYHLSYYNDNI